MILESSLDVIDVILMHDADNPNDLNAFFCPYCHYWKPVIQFVGKIVSITPGHAPLKLPIIKRCLNCKRNYAFNSVV